MIICVGNNAGHDHEETKGCAPKAGQRTGLQTGAFPLHRSREGVVPKESWREGHIGLAQEIGGRGLSGPIGVTVSGQRRQAVGPSTLSRWGGPRAACRRCSHAATCTFPRCTTITPFSMRMRRLLACPSQKASSTSTRGISVGTRRS